MLMDVPDRRRQGRQQTPREHASSSKRVQAENFRWITGIAIPVHQDVKDLGPDNARQNNENAQVPSLLRIDALLFRVADADPETKQHSCGNQEPVGGQAESADVKEFWKH